MMTIPVGNRIPRNRSVNATILMRRLAIMNGTRPWTVRTDRFPLPILRDRIVSPIKMSGSSSIISTSGNDQLRNLIHSNCLRRIQVRSVMSPRCLTRCVLSSAGATNENGFRCSDCNSSSGFSLTKGDHRPFRVECLHVVDGPEYRSRHGNQCSQNQYRSHEAFLHC